MGAVSPAASRHRREAAGCPLLVATSLPPLQVLRCTRASQQASEDWQWVVQTAGSPLAAAAAAAATPATQPLGRPCSAAPRVRGTDAWG